MLSQASLSTLHCRLPSHPARSAQRSPSWGQGLGLSQKHTAGAHPIPPCVCTGWVQEAQKKGQERTPAPTAPPIWASMGRRGVVVCTSRTPTSSSDTQQGCAEERLLPGAEPAPPCPAAPASLWPSSTASALWVTPARPAQPRPWTRTCAGLCARV